ncbi:nuclear pore complex protein NUP62 [Acrasis kona]|uniref:Nuclear pore complex protein NUP62 n=1 Tax=Acrasis kona TaxID=1008807 RepID=A0AAW2ZPH2_9EUKA
MSFSFGAPATSGSSSGFSFGSSTTTPAATGNSGFTFGSSTPATTTSTSTPAFSFGSNNTTSTTAPTTGLSFGSSTTNSTPATTNSFSFGNPTGAPTSTPTNNTTSNTGFSFGSSAPTTTSTSTPAPTTTPSGFSFGSAPTSTASTTTAAPAFSFGAPSTTTPAKTDSPKISFGGDSTTSTNPTTSGFSFGGASTTSATTPAPTTSTSNAGFSFGTPASTSTTTTNTSTTTPAASTGFSFGSTTPSTKDDKNTSTAAPATGGFSFGATSSTDATPKPSGTLQTPTNPVSIMKKPDDKKDASPVASGVKISDAQSKLRTETVETIIRNWNNELSEDVTEFRKYADQVSRWDRDLIENEEKIARLMKSIEFIEANQDDVDTQIGAIEEKQKKLNEALQTMEGEVQQAFNISKLQLPDEERKNTYNLAENINKQLDGMSRSLKEMIETLNSSYDNTLHKNTDTNNIVKILNNHLNSLQWIDHKTGSLHQQILKAEDEVRRLRL